MEQFEQLLTCAICLDRYRNPKLLPCQHSFCMEPCMDGLVDYVRRQVKCPECRAEHRIPYQGVQAFPTNVTLQRFLELHIEITGELPDPTSGQIMERCSVCSEKSYCNLCAHCEKKCCPECKEEHIKILRKNITSINSQVRRALHRLQEALSQVEKNTLALQTNSTAVAEEVDEIYRRLNKALKDRTEFLRTEIDRYLSTELRGLIHLKENLEQEIANIQSNCDLADAHINENVPWDDNELLDTKELFLRTLEFIRNFEYEAGDYSRRMRFVMTHEPNQLVLHVAGYGELNIKPETGGGGLLGSSSSLSVPGGSPGLMRSKSDHRLASQYRQQDDDRTHGRNRYVPDYEYDTPDYEAPRSRSRYRSRFMRNRDGEDSDGDTRSTVRFNAPQEPSALRERERVLDTEDASRGPLSGIFRLTDSPRVMKKLNECERAGKRKKDEPQQQPQNKSQAQQAQRKAVTPAVGRQVSEDDEISRIKKQNKASPATAASPVPEIPEERQPQPQSPQHQQQPQPVVAHTPSRDVELSQPEETARKTPVSSRRTSTEVHAPGPRSASSESNTGSESSAGSGIRNTGASFTTEEMKQKYLSRAPQNNTPSAPTAASNQLQTNRESPVVPTAATPRPFKSRFLGNRAAPPPPTEPVKLVPKKEEEEDEEETSSSSEETETESEEDSEPEDRAVAPNSAPMAPNQQRNESAMARTDIGPLLARSAEARRGSKEESPGTRYGTPRSSPAQSVTTPASTNAISTTPGGYTSRFVSSEHDIHDFGSNSSNPLAHDRSRILSDHDNDNDDDVDDDDEHDDKSSVDEASDPKSSSTNIREFDKRDEESSSSSQSDRPVVVVALNDASDNSARPSQSTGDTDELAEQPRDHEVANDSNTTNKSPGDVKIFVEGKRWNSLEDNNETAGTDEDDYDGDSTEESMELDSRSRTETEPSDSEREHATTERDNERFETDIKTLNENVYDKINGTLPSDNDEDDDNEDDIEDVEVNNSVIKENGYASDDGSLLESEEESVNEKKARSETDTESETELSLSESEGGNDEDKFLIKTNEVTDNNSKNLFIDDNVPIKQQTLEEGQKLFDDNGWVVTDENSVSNYQQDKGNSVNTNGWVGSDESRTEMGLTVDKEKEINNNKTEETNLKDGHWSIGENGWVVMDDEETTANSTSDGALQTARPGASSPIKQEPAAHCPEGEESANDASLPMKMVTTVFCVSVLCCSVLINLFM